MKRGLHTYKPIFTYSPFLRNHLYHNPVRSWIDLDNYLLKPPLMNQDVFYFQHQSHPRHRPFSEATSPG